MYRCTPLALTLGLGNYPTQLQRAQSSTCFRKSHHFDVVNQTPMLAEGNRPGTSGKPLYPCQSEQSIFPRSRKGNVPSWTVYEKQVLRFYAYFKETLPEVNRIPYQIRSVKISFFLDDDTIQIHELRGELGTQCLVSRQRIRKARPLSDSYITLLDFNVDTTISLLDRVYHITDCDVFTRNFLNRLGIAVPSPVETPKDPATEIRKMEKQSMVAKHPTPKDYRFAQFLRNDRKVLRFSAYWDDRKSENGDVRVLEVLYHLADDTFEIKEKLPPNCGRQSNGMFLKRAKLPRNSSRIKDVGEGNVGVLNVLGKNSMKARYLKDRLDMNFGDDDGKFYNEKDLQVGKIISVYGRDVMLTGCDAQTREFYRQKYGIEDVQPLVIPTHEKYSKVIRTEFEYPPFNGWGSFEDSEGNCTGLEPHAPRIDFRKFLEYDKLILRFGANMISDVKENNERRFLISYYLSDDTISVFELACRNAGFKGGEFIGKSKIYFPGQDKFTSHRPKAYTSQDLYLGAIVNFRNFIFKIVSADLFALNFMEEHKEIYPMSHPHIILSKVKGQLNPIYKDFIANYMTRVKTVQEGENSKEFIDYEDFKNMLRDLLGEAITEQEIVTLCRYFAIKTKKSPREYRELIKSIVQGEITRGLWNDTERLKEFIYHLSPTNVEFLSEKQMRRVIKACKIPIDDAIIVQLFEVLYRNENLEIEVQDFFNFIDLTKCKACPVPPVNPKKNQFHFEVDEGSLIDWEAFIDYLGFEAELRKSNE